MADAFMFAIAAVALIIVWRNSGRVPLITANLFVLITGAWLGANLRASGWEIDFGNDVPDALDPITRGMFLRGWPVSPCVFSLIHRMRFQPSGLEWPVLVFNWFVLVVSLNIANFLSNRLLRWRGGSTQARDGTTDRRAEG